MDPKYHPQTVEEKWQKRWLQERTFAAPDEGERPKYYVLEMFPYPSGRIHMGHVRNYTIGDVVARYKRMKGFRVLHPMGWDAFGMPAENAAIQHGIHPAVWTRKNIGYMKGQLERMGFSYDWDRELATCDPSYYRWEQWLFLKMLDKGLAYRKRTTVNWCGTCETVLANEQVEQGACWRCGKPVGQKDLFGWFFRITHYADELLDATERLPGWPPQVLAMQRNWIGKSYGTEAEFPLVGRDGALKIFTTRPDTLYGVTFMSLAAEHPLVAELVAGTPREAEVLGFVDRVKRDDKIKRSSEDYEKEGVFTGAWCVHPLTGEKVPIYAANFVLMEYGTGAVMAVPAHDQRDFEFARKYGIPVKVVIQPEGAALDGDSITEAYVDEGRLVNSAGFGGLPNVQAMDAITDELAGRGLGKKTVNYRLRDWGISRQRYWGAPIPVVHCEACGVVPVPEDELPVALPEDVEFPEGRVLPLAEIPPFYETRCPRCGAAARRETDTMDTFVESSWYFARFACADFDRGMLDRARVEPWMPVDQYIGGIEHAVLHLLYSRFYTRVLRDLGVAALDEPFTNLLTQGMVCMETQRCSEHGWLFPEEVEDGACRHCRRPVETGRIEKMSKSKKNLVDPEGLVARYGADTARLFSLFAAPPEKDLEWNEEGVEGAYRFLRRVWRLVADNAAWLPAAPARPEGELSAAERKLRGKVHETIVRVTENIEDRFHFNTAIAAAMELVNEMAGFVTEGAAARAVFREAVEVLLKVLSPMVPHLAEELWEALGQTVPLADTAWPNADPDALVRDEITVVVQVNGKVRGRLQVAPSASEEEVRDKALADENVSRFVGGQSVRKCVYVSGRLLSLVVG
ncbi:MAG: leucine--tRNA ligase [Deltaproteobacteria bacterium]|nr:leucine--tRNA ligase [Deltaproteobacteria bacterium]